MIKRRMGVSADVMRSKMGWSGPNNMEMDHCMRTDYDMGVGMKDQGTAERRRLGE